MPSETFIRTGSPISASGAISTTSKRDELIGLRDLCLSLARDIDAGVGLGSGDGEVSLPHGKVANLLREGLPIKDAAIVSAIEASTAQSIRVAAVLDRIEAMLSSSANPVKAQPDMPAVPTIAASDASGEFQLREPAPSEGARRRKDEVFGKKHPLWRPVTDYATARVRGLGKPMSAKEIADLIRTTYPQFKVDVKSVPNRLVAMGMYRVAKKGMIRPVKFWYGDGIPDGYERSS